MAKPLSQYCVVNTHDPAEAEDQVGRIFCSHKLEPLNAFPSLFHAQHNHVKCVGFSLNLVAYGADVAIDPGCLDRFFLLQIPLKGGALIRCGSSTVMASPTRASILSPTLPTRMRWVEGTEKLILQIEREYVERRMRALLERDVATIEFDGSVDLDAPLGAALLAQTTAIQSLCERGSPSDLQISLAHDAIRDGVIGMLLALQPHNLTPLLRRQQCAAAPAHVKRAEAYIRQNFDLPIAMEDVAMAAGSSLRALQAGFRRFREMTLSQAIQNARLAHWRHLLLDASIDSHIGDLALAAGLSHMGRSAGAYRRRYGEKPSETRLNRRRQ